MSDILTILRAMSTPNDRGLLQNGNRRAAGKHVDVQRRLQLRIGRWREAAASRLLRRPLRFDGLEFCLYFSYVVRQSWAAEIEDDRKREKEKESD